jgi:hypothetical protein
LQINLGLPWVYELPGNVLGSSWTPSFAFFNLFGHKHIILDMDTKYKKQHHAQMRSYKKTNLDMCIYDFHWNQYRKMHKSHTTTDVTSAVWYGMVWYGMVWYGMVPYGMVP